MPCSMLACRVSLLPPDALLTQELRQEAMSIAYIHAVAAMAGYTTAPPVPDVDGVDLRVQAGGWLHPNIDIQVKATTRLGSPDDGFFRFPLKIGNYDLLRERTQVPRLLVVLGMPPDEEEWLSQTADALVMKRCAYWLGFKECEPVENKYTVTVRIPQCNVFDLLGLQSLMEMSRNGVI